jgi:DNA-binding XRE family transcriptional regulator
MSKRRTAKTVRLNSHRIASLGRTRPTRKAAKRKRPTPKLLPEKLKAIREHLGLSQSEIAIEIGVTDRSSVSGYERGEREPPLPILLKYARLAGISTDELIDDDMKFQRR